MDKKVKGEIKERAEKAGFIVLTPDQFDGIYEALGPAVDDILASLEIQLPD